MRSVYLNLVRMKMYSSDVCTNESLSHTHLFATSANNNHVKELIFVSREEQG